VKILMIIPAYNEQDNIKETVKKIQEHSTKLDYVVINDGSTDNTQKILEENNIKHIKLINNLGIGGAVQTGYKYAYRNNYDIAIQFDGDGQHDANYIKNIVEPIVKGDANMVIGSRYVEELSEFKSTKLRQLGITILSFILKLTTGKKIYDMTSGFRAVDKDIIEIFAKDYPNDYPEPETNVEVVQKGFKVKEIPVKMHERLHGKSSITPLKSIYYMIKVSYAMIVRSIIERRRK